MADRGLLGVAPLLGPDAKVYYDTIFTTTHLGRVSDLVAAKLRDASTHEFRLRMVMLRLMFEAYRHCAPEALGSDPLQPLTRLDAPLSVECGITAGKIGFSVAYPLPDGDPAFKALESGSFSLESISKLKSLLSALRESCSVLHVRGYESSLTVEVTAVLELDAQRAGLEDTAPIEAKLTTEWVPRAAPAAPQAREYIQLADLEYDELLKPDDLRGPSKPKLGELLAEGSSKESAQARRVSGQQEEDKGELRKVSGDSLVEEEAIRISGGGNTGQQRGWRTVGKGADGNSADSNEAESELATVIRGSSSGEEAPLLHFDSPASELPDALETLEEETEEEDENFIQKILKKFFGDKKTNDGETRPVSAPLPTPASEPAPEESADAEAAPERPEVQLSPESQEESIAEVTGKAMDAELGQLEARIQRAQKEALELDSKDPKAKRLVDGLMADVMAEKARLQELSKKVNLSVRQKEIEFRNRATQMQEELRRRDEALRQKEFALNRSKEQITQLTNQLDRSRAGAKEGGEDGNSKQKLLHVQKLLAGTKEENRFLATRIEDMKKQITTMQMHARTRGAANQEFAAIQSKFEKAVRQLEEFKRANQQLVEKLNRAEERSRQNTSGAGNDDTKKRLEASMRQLTLTKRESERLAAKVAEMQREDMRQRAEIARLNGEMKRLSKSAPMPEKAVPAAPAAADPNKKKGVA